MPAEERAVYTAADVLGNLVCAAEHSAAALAAVHNSRIKHNGGCNLDGCRRGVLVLAVRVATANVLADAAPENAGAALSSEKNDLFLDSGNTVKFLISSSDARFAFEMNEETYCNAEKAAVELYGVDADVRARDMRAFYAHVPGMFDYLLSEIREEHPCVFITVAVAA